MLRIALYASRLLATNRYRRPKMVTPISPVSSITMTKLCIINLITYWSILSVASYEIWSVYFDDTIPSISENNFRFRRQLFTIPFSQERQIFQISNYINASNHERIRSMELTRCRSISSDEDDVRRLRTLPRESEVINPANGIAYTCLQRIAAQMAPIVANATIVHFPQDVGLRLGETTTTTSNDIALMLSIEYDEDYRKLNDDSGFELFLSDDPLPIDADIMAVGLVPDRRFILPPQIDEWTTRGSCDSACYRYQMEHDKFAIVSAFPAVRHRSLQELSVEIAEPSGSKRKIYSFGGESSVDNSEESIVSWRDRVNVRCTYRASNRSIMGGFGEQDENCLVWLHYYPKIPDMEACMSSYSAATIMSLLDVDDLNATMSYDTGIELTIRGESLEKVVQNKDQTALWNVEKLHRSQFSVINGRQTPQCGWNVDMPEMKRRRRKRRRRR